MFYDLDEHASFEHWDGDPLQDAEIIDADDLFVEVIRPPAGMRAIRVAPEPWPETDDDTAEEELDWEESWESEDGDYPYQAPRLGD